MNDVAGLLQQSAALVKTWGESRLPSGKTLAEALTVYGIPLWDAFVVDLARLHLPRALARGGRRPSLAERVRPHLSLAKDTALGLMRSRPGLQGCPEWPSVPTVLLLGFSAYIYRDVLQSVAARLASRSDVHPVSLYDGRCAGATASSVDHRGFHAISQHWDGGRGSGELRRALAAAVADLYTSGALPKIIRDQEGRPLWRQTRDTFNRVFRVYLPRLLPLAAVAHHIVDSHRPALIVSPDVADPRTRLYTLIAGRCGIPTLEVQFGACGPEHIEWRFMAADRVAAWGKQSAEMLVVHGVTPERIAVTGSPRHDHLQGLPDVDVVGARARLGVPPGNVMVLLASVYYLDEYGSVTDPALPELLRAMKVAVFEAAERIPGLSLVVKPHPQEDVGELKRLVGSRRNVRVVDPRGDIRELIKVCDAFVALAGSTSVLDALIAHKLTICPAFPGWIWSNLFVDTGATLVPRSAEEISRCLRMVVDTGGAQALTSLEQARQRLLNEWVTSADGQASSRAEALMLEMAGLEVPADRYGFTARAG